MPLERNDAVKADAAYVKEQCTALPAMAAQADANVAAAAPARSSLRWFLGIVWEAARGRRWTRVLFFLAFVTVSTFYFKDQRLAEEAKKQAAEAELPPAAVRATWVRLPESELAKLGLRRITPQEFGEAILPDTVVVVKGRQDQKGFRVAYTENDFAFAQSLVTGQYYAFHVAGLERKRVPDEMPAQRP